MTEVEIIKLAFEYGLKYGPIAGKAIIALFKKADPTLDDADKVFDDLKSWDSFGIPDKVPEGSPTDSPVVGGSPS